jgi:hypothetical protein
MTCPSCGTTAATGARFCAACGHPLDTDLKVSASDERTRMAPTAAPDAHTTSGGSGWLTSAGSISHGRFAPGAVLEGRYRVIGLVGRGGMGEVYRADDLRLGQPVALKFLPDEVGKDAGRLAQFHNEVRAARQVSHPNICRVYDIGETAGHLFLSMELVDGEDLAASLRRIGRFPEDKALDIARQLCAGLAAAHDRGVLHRDLKPANVMLDAAGKVRLMDFGLADAGGEAGVRAGTPGYMAPEQLQGRDATVQSDVYALGLVLYELFTGRRAFTAATLTSLAEQQQAGRVTPPSAIISNLDPAIERAIMRCLEVDPDRRPASALAVSAALPGGDPLAAALAAGETPSPEMVAAAGKGAGLSRAAAGIVLGLIVIGIAASYALGVSNSAIQHVRPQLSADVLAQKARESLRTLGVTEPPYDEVFQFAWDGDLVDHLERDHSQRDWSRLASERPSPLTFLYRRSPRPLIGGEFHHDLLTPGLVTSDDPPPIISGMAHVSLDHEGRLRAFEAIPEQHEEKDSAAAPVEWAPLFTLAGLDPATLTPVAPRWNWLSGPDTRMAWTGKWPGSDRELRVEAGARAGRPVAFLMSGAWTTPSREAPASNFAELFIALVLIGFAVAIIVSCALLARKNLRDGRGDRTAAFRLGCAVVVALWMLWLCQGHFTASIGVFGAFLITVCTTVSYGVLFWAIYLALEPFVRRHWPQTLVSWTTLLGGRVRDPIVGRDLLVGVAVGVAIPLIIRLSDRLTVPPPVTITGDLLLGVRSAAGVIIQQAIYGVRSALLIFYLLFLLRAVLRNQWAAAIALVVIFTGLDLLDFDRSLLAELSTAVYFALLAFTVLRWGLTSLAVAFVVAGLLLTVPVTTDRSAWFFGTTVALNVLPLALAVWAFVVSVPAQRVKRASVFD